MTGVCLTAAAALACDAAAPAEAPTVPVLVAAVDLPAGRTLARSDVRIARMSPDLVPSGAPRRSGDVLGRATAVSVPAGTPLVPGVVRADGGRPAAPPGRVLAPVHLSDPSVTAFLAPGDRVDVLAAGPEATSTGIAAIVVARRALVVEAPGAGPNASSSGILGTATAAEDSPFLLLAVSTDEAVELAVAALSASLSAVIVE